MGKGRGIEESAPFLRTMIDRNLFLPSKVVNRARLLFDFLVRREKTKGLPLEIGVEIINVCNLRCIMCPYGEMVAKKTRPQKKMSFSLFKKIIDEIASFAELIYLHGLGEPLLHPQIFEFINYAKEKDIRVGISTNVMLLDKKRSKKLLDSGIDYLILAMDGATKETYEKIRVGGDFGRVEKNIKNFLKMKKERKKKPFVVIQFITMEENEKEIDLFLKKWQGKGADVVRIKPKISLKDKDKRGKAKITPYCFHIFRQLNINSDGTVVPCCEDVHGRYPLGNVKKSSLKELWNSEKMQILRKKNFQNKRQEINICKTCLYPQPTTLETVGVMIFDHLTVKKILPRIENLARERLGALYG